MSLGKKTTPKIVWAMNQWLKTDSDDVPHQDKIYRVYVCPHTTKVHVTCIGMDNVDSEVNGTYDTPDDLPDWIQNRVAVLMLTPLDKPTKTIEGIGRRIDKNVFWVFRG